MSFRHECWNRPEGCAGRVVFGLPGRPTGLRWRKGSGVVMVPETLVERWEVAYRKYGDASRAAATAVPGDPDAAREMAAASLEVAAAWREMEAISELPWWVLAALGAGAQAFEFQARDWNARAQHAWPDDEGARLRPQVRLATRAQPTPHSRRRARDTP